MAVPRSSNTYSFVCWFEFIWLISIQNRLWNMCLFLDTIWQKKKLFKYVIFFCTSTTELLNLQLTQFFFLFLFGKSWCCRVFKMTTHERFLVFIKLTMKENYDFYSIMEIKCSQGSTFKAIKRKGCLIFSLFHHRD